MLWSKKYEKANGCCCFAYICVENVDDGRFLITMF